MYIYDVTYAKCQIHLLEKIFLLYFTEIVQSDIVDSPKISIMETVSKEKKMIIF